VKAHHIGKAISSGGEEVSEPIVPTCSLRRRRQNDSSRLMYDLIGNLGHWNKIAVIDRGLSCRQAAERFGVSASSAIRWLNRLKKQGDVAAKRFR
jgi:transposase-like protein